MILQRKVFPTTQKATICYQNSKNQSFKLFVAQKPTHHTRDSCVKHAIKMMSWCCKATFLRMRARVCVCGFHWTRFTSQMMHACMLWTYLHCVTVVFNINCMCTDSCWREFSIKSTLHVAFNSYRQFTMRTSHTNCQLGCSTSAYTNMKCCRLFYRN